VAGLLLGFADALGVGVEAVAATCDGVGLSGADGAVWGDGAPELHAAAADTRTKALATAKALGRKRTGANTSPTIAPSSEINALVFFESLLIA
jgi:hypothetical protein